MSIYRDYMEHGIPVFPLHEFSPEGCACGFEHCNAAGKHPRSAGWQNTPLWSDEQVDWMEESGQFSSGWGALLSGGLLVVDVDARNGGLKSFEKLAQEIPEAQAAGYIVHTGSQDGSKHLYFKLEGAPKSLAQALQEYPGIDFKSSGFVVGPGSKHVSGHTYTVAFGDIHDIDPAPASLLELLSQKSAHRTKIDGVVHDVTDQDIVSMLQAVDPDSDYGKWIRCGMAVHQATQGSGFELWNAWSKNGKKYPGQESLKYHWHSFGKSKNPVGLGTLAHYAQEGGWTMPVTFDPGPAPEPTNKTPQKEHAVDLLRPPGFVGEIAQWINATSRYKRERLAVAAALYLVSSAGGMRYADDYDGFTPNIVLFGVSASATGKEHIFSCVQNLLYQAGLSPAVHGGVKSEQETVRNLMEHQAALYMIDEMGEVLKKLTTARQSGATPYLSGVIGQIMAIYTKANGILPVTGDISRSLKAQIAAEKAAYVKKHGEDPDDSKLTEINERLERANKGIINPYLNIFGLTTPVVFDELLTHNMATAGFLGRAMIFREQDDNPRYSTPEKCSKMFETRLAMSLRQLYSPGKSDLKPVQRIEQIGSKDLISTEENAKKVLDECREYFWEKAESHEDTTGLTAIPRRGYELVAKISLVLAMPTGVRTEEHVRWAWAWADRDIESKCRMVQSTESDSDQAVYARILEVIGDDGETLGKIRNRCRKWSPDIVSKSLVHLVKTGKIDAKTVSFGRGGRKTTKYVRA